MKDHIEKLQKELNFINSLRNEFPDLEMDKDRWGHIRYMARSANSRVTEVFFHRNCGCCSDSPIHARPYLKFNGEYIYSHPCNVMIGEPYIDGDGFREYEGWDDLYIKADINPAVLEKIKNYIKEKSNFHFYEEDEEDEEDEEGA